MPKTRLHPLVRHALAMPPGEAGAKAARFALRAARGRIERWRMAGRCTYPGATGPDATGRLSPRLGLFAPDAAALAPLKPVLGRLARHWLNHRFDLLGSGWVRVAHGAAYAGFGPHRYGPHAALPEDGWREALAEQATPGNRARALGILTLIESAGYVPIDWHVDMRSGWRWDPRAWGPSAPYGHKPGVDIKLPWELGRLQHLPGLALGHLAGVEPSAAGNGGASPLARAFRDQVLDFWAANPPGFGVNWACAMEVAIRAANVALAWDLFRAAGHAFDDAFERELAALMLAHGRFIAAHLEWHPKHRANHYLADVTGLAFAAAYSEESAETDMWLAFAARALEAEIQRQFDDDGAGFEASTAYHRLSAELALHGVALITGLPDGRRHAIAACDPARWRGPAPFPPAAAGAPAWPPFSDATYRRLAGAARFAHDCTKPSGAIVQIGDNDSGRLFKLTPSARAGDESLAENPLDIRPLIAASLGLIDPGLSLPPPDGFAVERAVVRALAGGAPPRPIAMTPRASPRKGDTGRPAAASDRARRVERVRFPLDHPGVLDGIELCAYPAFGLYIWRGPRAFVSIRCGPVGQNGQGGHAHNDALAVDIELDGVALARDPGSFVYTADLAQRDRWRSVMAHFAPRDGAHEPNRLRAPFRLDDRARAEALAWDPAGFVGRHTGFARPVYRRLEIGPAAITVEDRHGGWAMASDANVREITVTTPAELARAWPLTVPFSAGYGLVDDGLGAGSIR